MSECTHPADQVQVIVGVGKGVYITSPQLLWCRACGAMAATDGGLVDVRGYKEVPPGSSAWVGLDDWNVPEESGPDTWGPEATKVIQRERELRLELEAEVADLRQCLAQLQDRHGRDLLRVDAVTAENDTLKKAVLQDQKYRLNLDAENIRLQQECQEWRGHAQQMGARATEAEAELAEGQSYIAQVEAGAGEQVRAVEAKLRNEERAHRTHELAQGILERKVKELVAEIARFRKVPTIVKVPVVDLKDLRAACGSSGSLQELTLRDEVTALHAECEERAETMRGQVKEIRRLEGELTAERLGVEVGMPPPACCVLCNLPITTGGIRGMGDGSGNRFAHEVCYWRKRAEDAETVGDYADDLRDRVCLQDDNKVLQLKVEEMRAEASEALSTLAEMEVNQEALDRRIKTLEAKLVDAKSMKHSYWEELKAISECVPPGEHDRHLTHQGALLQRVEDLMGRYEHLETENVEMRETIQLVGGDKVLVAVERRKRRMEVETLQAEVVLLEKQRDCAIRERDDLKHDMHLERVYRQEDEAKVAKEKTRRVYYQDIVYHVCNVLDLLRPGLSRVVCGTVDEPSREVQEVMAEVLTLVGNLKRDLVRNAVPEGYSSVKDGHIEQVQADSERMQKDLAVVTVDRNVLQKKVDFAKSWDKQVRDFLRALTGRPIQDEYETGHTIDECLLVEGKISDLKEENGRLKEIARAAHSLSQKIKDV